MKKTEKFDTVMPLIKERFEKGESFVFKPNGVSMLPFIKGGETSVEIEKYEGGAGMFDIVFYVRGDGKYVMHRIVKMYKIAKMYTNSFGVCGDNQWWIEEVKEEQIFAIVRKVSGRRLPGNWLYLHTLPLRRFVIHVIQYLKKHMRGEKK